MFLLRLEALLCGQVPFCFISELVHSCWYVASSLRSKLQVMNVGLDTTELVSRRRKRQQGSQEDEFEPEPQEAQMTSKVPRPTTVEDLQLQETEAAENEVGQSSSNSNQPVSL